MRRKINPKKKKKKKKREKKKKNNKKAIKGPLNSDFTSTKAHIPTHRERAILKDIQGSPQDSGGKGKRNQKAKRKICEIFPNCSKAATKGSFSEYGEGRRGEGLGQQGKWGPTKIPKHSLLNSRKRGRKTVLGGEVPFPGSIPKKGGDRYPEKGGQAKTAGKRSRTSCRSRKSIVKLKEKKEEKKKQKKDSTAGTRVFQRTADGPN